MRASWWSLQEHAFWADSLLTAGVDPLTQTLDEGALESTPEEYRGSVGAALIYGADDNAAVAERMLSDAGMIDALEAHPEQVMALLLHEGLAEGEEAILKDLGSPDPEEERRQIDQRVAALAQRYLDGEEDRTFWRSTGETRQRLLAGLDPSDRGPTQPYLILKAVSRLLVGAGIGVGDVALLWGLPPLFPDLAGLTPYAALVSGFKSIAELFEGGKDLGEALARDAG